MHFRLVAGAQAVRQRRILTRSWATVAWVLAAVVTGTSCGETVVDYDSLYVSVTAEATAKPIVSLDLALHSVAGVVPAVKIPEKPDDPLYIQPLLWNIVTKPFVLKVVQPTAKAGLYQLRIRGLDAEKNVQAASFQIIDTRKSAIVNVILRGPRPECDADGDGMPDCKKAGCCSDVALGDGDCNDTPGAGASASPFSTEDACTQCADGVDQDCDGIDTPCVDTDKDGVKDCEEIQKCFPGAEADAAISPKGIEICDNKDNNCDGQVDEGLPFVGPDGKPASVKKGEACGQGVCAGGKAVCAPLAAEATASTGLVCDSSGQKTAEKCDNDKDDDCDGVINNSCTLQDIDGDGINNVDEDDCKFTFAKFHAEFHPGAKETCCAKGKDETLCDTNCDGKVTPCGEFDQDGDGHVDENKGGDDCDDKDPLVYPKAPEKCGDGKVMGCVGADPSCPHGTDADGDGFSIQDGDCDDGNKDANPWAKELCNGKDDNCNGLADDGNPGTGQGQLAADAPCGNTKGECGHQGQEFGLATGYSVCKHWPKGQLPGALDCLVQPFDAAQLICVGCEGDARPAKDTCNYMDDNCDGKTDEDYLYAQQNGTKLPTVGDSGKQDVQCDGIGACSVGLVECLAKLDIATCTTDANGTKSQKKEEVCNNQDDDCNGQTDEKLTDVASSTCQKTGVCGGPGTTSIQTVCVAGQWLCDYSKVPTIEYDKAQSCAPGSAGCQCDNLGQQCWKMLEVSCDGLDNDCDGKTDDDFSYAGLGAQGKTLLVTDGCGTGACAAGKVVCTTDKQGLVCDTDSKVKDEQCNGKDDDCDAKTDELTDASMALSKAPCKQIGQCAGNVAKATCPAGLWVCDYTDVPAYEGGQVVTCDAGLTCPGSAELTCDGKDNDCDGKSDEDFTFDDLGQKRFIGEGCGTGVCKTGSVICSATPKTATKEMTCSTLPKQAAEICDGADNDCNGKTDELFAYVDQGGVSLKMLQTCDGIGACGVGSVECLSTSAATCSTDPNGSKKMNSPEICDDFDNDCNGKVDEKCDDDKDGYCDVAIQTIGTPKVCLNGGGDCMKDDVKIYPKAPELCDGIDNNCSGKADEIFFYKELDKTGASLGVGVACGLGVCAGGTVVCKDTLGANCSTNGKKGAETCNGSDDNCDGITDEGCDDDKDGYCDVGMGWAGGAIALTCPNTKVDTQRDCDDNNAKVFPSATEICNDVDDNCVVGTDEGCDDDKDGYCDINMTVVSPAPKTCLKGPGDCGDFNVNINPGATERCNSYDDNCSQISDEGCDDDKDGFCDSGMILDVAVGSNKYCPGSQLGKSDDCNDADVAINPGAKETCNDKDDNCTGATDEGCDDDTDQWCDAAIATVGKPKVCSNGGGDCVDTDSSLNPAATEKCNNKDDNCVTGTDEGCDDDLDGYCDVAMTVVGSPAVCTKSKLNTADDCDDKSAKANPGGIEICNDIDDNCNGVTDEGCDDDKDGYCDLKIAVLGVPKVCPKGSGDCNDASLGVNPGQVDACDALNVDENCDGVTDGPDAGKCTVFYKDLDGDGFGISTKLCLCGPDSGNKLTAIVAGDCNDAALAINPGAKEQCATPGVDDNCNSQTDESNAVGCNQYWLDNDVDKYGAGSPKCMCLPDSQAQITATQAGDCDDTKVGVNPLAIEVCNGLDDNCDNKIDPENAGSCKAYFLDADGDAFGLLNSASKCLCTADLVNMYKATVAGDCNDVAAKVFPGATELCDSQDNNCNTKVDEEGASGCKNWFLDQDADTYGAPVAKCLCGPDAASLYTSNNTADCNDNVKTVNPGATETCATATIDDNCNGKTDEENAATCKTWYLDKDVDTYGTTSGKCLCAADAATFFTSANTTDCNDNEKTVNPGTAETCATAGLDDNCNGKADEENAATCKTYYVDKDVDTFGSTVGSGKCLCAADAVTFFTSMTKTDCNDNDKAINTTAAELCNGVDDNCDGITDTGADPAAAACSKLGICAAAATSCLAGKWDCGYPLAYEVSETSCDGIDSNCSGATDEPYKYDDAGTLKAIGVKCGDQTCNVQCAANKKYAECPCP